MRYSKRYIVFTIVICMFMLVKFQFTGQSYARVSQFRGADLKADAWNPLIAAASNQGRLLVSVDGREYTNQHNGIYMDDNLRIMLPVDMIRDAFDCSAHVYDRSLLMVEKRDTVLQFPLNHDYYILNEEEMEMVSPLVARGDELYVAMEPLAMALGYTYQWDRESNMVTSANTATDVSSILPYRYDLRERGRAPAIKDQGVYGTCWAFAALTALESSLMPEEQLELSVDHMDQNNSFTSPSQDGGQYTMAMAYLAAWQGPVYEADDPYGDGITDAGLKSVKHVQDMQIIESKNLDGIKEAVFKYGGVESCIYTTMQGSGGISDYYNGDACAYCYVGEEKPNHDVVIIGWDDSFPKEYFTANLEGDGAFICQNSWGSNFGDDGVFYVSYYDTNIGIHNMVYTGIEETDNYDRIYQSDLCGWVGQMGYNKESVYGANVYTARSDQEIAATGFYATGKDTGYKVYVTTNFKDKDSLNDRKLVAQGQLSNAGYHTIRFEQPVFVEKNQRFAVVVWLSTPNAVRPMAIEYVADDLTRNVDLSDGEGYISAQGHSWVSAEKTSKCNLCIKAYANTVDIDPQGTEEQ